MSRVYTIGLIGLALLTVLSLALNVVVLLGLGHTWRIAQGAQETTQTAVDDARSILSDVGNEIFVYTIEVQQDVPIEASIPVDEEVVVPIRTTIPISTVVVIPIEAGVLGTYNVDVPVQTLVPIDLEFSMPISETVNVATTVPLDVDVPIEIPIAETPLAEYIAEIDAALGRLEDGLERLGRNLTGPLGGE